MSLSLVVATVEASAPADVEDAATGPADVVEVRLDGLALDEVPAAIEAVDRPALATCRRTEDGGAIEVDEDERRLRLEAALEAGSALVDVERDASFRQALTAKAHRANARVIVSDHALDGTPSPDAILDRLGSMREGADVVKLATRAGTPEHVDRLLEAATHAPRLGVPFALMGVGDATLRGLAGPLGMALVYTAPGGVGVPGQLATSRQAELPRGPPAPRPLDDYLLLGHPVAHSLSPPMHEAAFRALGEPARYRLIDAPPARLEAVLDGLTAARACGGNATAPHKRALFEACDTVTDTARALGVANTFRVEDGALHGHMTDGIGAVRALEARGEALEGRAALVVGAGGTGRAAAHALADAGATVRVANRTRAKAKRLADEVSGSVVTLDASALADAIPEGGLVFNATPVDPPVPDEALARASAFDANYGPERDAFAHRARAAGADTLDGLDLILGQGVPALAFWLEREIPEKVQGRMRTAVRTAALEARYGRPSR